MEANLEEERNQREAASHQSKTLRPAIRSATEENEKLRNTTLHLGISLVLLRFPLLELSRKFGGSKHKVPLILEGISVIPLYFESYFFTILASHHLFVGLTKKATNAI